MHHNHPYIRATTVMEIIANDSGMVAQRRKGRSYQNEKCSVMLNLSLRLEAGV